MKRNTAQKIARRYPLNFAVRYVIGPPETARTGIGETVWMSRSELAFRAEGPACVGDKLVICIEWPVLLRGEVPLQLAVGAEITQRLGPLSVAKLTRHEFRTRSLQCSAAARQRPPAQVWEMPSTRQMPATQTLGSVSNRQPAMASAARG